MAFKGLYVHIPFCVRKCNYCDFCSYPAKDYQAAMGDYSSWLKKELDAWKKEDLSSLASVYFGGGTPTLLPQDALADVFSHIKRHCNLHPQAEVSMECNPGTVDIKDLLLLRQMGVNRLSIGIESFAPKYLHLMGRIADAADGPRMVEAARHAGFDNLNIDLIYGLPGQTLAEWRDDLERAIDLGTEHISLYGLSLSDKTPWGRAVAAGSLSLPDEDLLAEMMELAQDMIKGALYHHYEIANFAKPGFECRHNLTYWQREDYLGIGVAAASCYGNIRQMNCRGLEEYQNSLYINGFPEHEKEILSRQQLIGEAVFLGLRLIDGIRIKAFNERFGVDMENIYQEQLRKLFSYGLLEKTDGCLHLTKKGILLANVVFGEFI